MNKIKFFSVVFLALGYTSFAQDVEAAKKAIDAEQYEKAKSILKVAVKNMPDNGKAAFLLGNVYLRQNLQDSAKIFFDKGLKAKELAAYNYIGLGQIDLDNGNASAAQFNFDQATKDMKKKDLEQYVFIGKAYTNSDNPNFKKAIEVLNKAKAINMNDAQTLLALGDAYYGDKNQNEAYAAYRNAATADPSLLRAKMQLGVLLKGAKAYTEAKTALDKVLAENPNYGPVHRELAETYFGIALADKSKYKEYTAKALESYEKYMSLTDYSLASRMRHADFLIVAKDYKALEKEALEMKKLDNVNPRILRYLGYSSYENGNIDAAISALTEYTSNAKNKIIGRDYLYLGMAQLKKAIPAVTGDAKPVIDEAMYKTAVENFKKAVGLDKPMANELNDIGKVYFDQKLYKYAAGIYEVATSNPNSQNYLYDNFFLGYSLYFEYASKDVKKPEVLEALKKADVAFGNVTVASPTTQDAHIYRARVNGLLSEPAAKDQMAKSYEEFVKVVTAKGPETVEKNKSKFVESYQELARYYAKTDKVKSNDYIAKALALEPTNTDTLNLQKALK